MLDSVKTYIQNVNSGQVRGNTQVAKLIDQTLSLIPTDDNGKFDGVFSSSLQDLLACVYLANLTKTHLLLATQNSERD